MTMSSIVSGGWVSDWYTSVCCLLSIYLLRYVSVSFVFSFVCSPTNQNCRRKYLANCLKGRMDLEGILINHLSGCSSKCSAKTWQYVASCFCGFMFIFVMSTCRLCVVRRTGTVEGKIWQIVRRCGWIWREYWSTTLTGVLPSIRRRLGSMSRCWWEHRGSRLWPCHQLFWEVGYRIDTRQSVVYCRFICFGLSRYLFFLVRM